MMRIVSDVHLRHLVPLAMAELQRLCPRPTMAPPPAFGDNIILVRMMSSLVNQSRRKGLSGSEAARDKAVSDTAPSKPRCFDRTGPDRTETLMTHSSRT